ncbi:voltage-dependent anion channel-domain-containing protein [Sphaerosporella brunnea]|uniref:Voltage-dependent anion channel-domain-containing protein n=1 Tax=Sphaerosporella brunnea TaxID=1250544 RepID=A0A5J5F8W2_9PEZI|nr:voltage-dependent anion channel-domain-containing protein [Sphaerosporella brunnea]
MSIGGASQVLIHIPFRFKGQYTLGATLYFLSLAVFTLSCICITLRFCRFRHTFLLSLRRPTESLPGVRRGNAAGRGVIRGRNVYCLTALLFTVLIHMSKHTVENMTPLWTFPIYPLLLTGPTAGAIAPSQSQPHALQMGIAGLAFQGIGFTIALMIYSAYIYRLMTNKLPAAARPGMFVSVGPCAFTVIGLVNLG